MGRSDFCQMSLDLDNLIQSVSNLEHLESPFTMDEIDQIVADLPNNKSPGPDGYTNEFIKGCWPLVAEDFYKLFNAFYNGQICLRSINNSHIVLIPKKDGPQTVSDYRPISLLNTSLKLLTKLLVNRL